MSNKKEIVIKDACVLFDLIDLGILKQFYELDIVVYTTTAVIAEITNPSQLYYVTQYIDTQKLLIDVNGTYETIVIIIEKNPGLSFADGSVIELAIRINGTILSSDKSLRNESQRRDLQVKGVLWVIEELAKNKIIEVSHALQLLEEYPKINNRVPLNDINKLIKKYTNL